MCVDESEMPAHTGTVSAFSVPSHRCLSCVGVTGQFTVTGLGLGDVLTVSIIFWTTIEVHATDQCRKHSQYCQIGPYFLPNLATLSTASVYRQTIYGATLLLHQGLVVKIHSKLLDNDFSMSSFEERGGGGGKKGFFFF